MDAHGLDLDVLTPKQLDALRIAMEPRQARGAIMNALDVSKQALCNRRRRAAKALDTAAKAQARAA